MPHVVPGYEHGEAKRQMTQVKKHERMKQSGVPRTRYFKKRNVPRQSGATWAR